MKISLSTLLLIFGRLRFEIMIVTFFERNSGKFTKFNEKKPEKISFYDCIFPTFMGHFCGKDGKQMIALYDPENDKWYKSEKQKRKEKVIPVLKLLKVNPVEWRDLTERQFEEMNEGFFLIRGKLSKKVEVYQNHISLI